MRAVAPIGEYLSSIFLVAPLSRIRSVSSSAYPGAFFVHLSHLFILFILFREPVASFLHKSRCHIIFPGRPSIYAHLSSIVSASLAIFFFSRTKKHLSRVPFLSFVSASVKLYVSIDATRASQESGEHLREHLLGVFLATFECRGTPALSVLAAAT